jgi:tetratricopeptide (TPR) repeat protein
MTARALLLAPHDTDVQFTHSMLLLDADHAEMAGRVDELLAWLPCFAPQVRLQIVVRMGEHHHVRFADAVDLALAEAPPDVILATSATPSGGGVMMSFGNVATELFGELGEAILALAPVKMARLVPLLPGDVSLLAALAWKSIQAGQRDCAIALYDRVLALPIPVDGEDRQNYLRAINNACIQAHAAKAYEAAVRIADRAQPVAHENPYIFHSAACAYAAAGDYARAFEQVKLAVQHEYEHLSKVEVDSDLGPLLEWPEFKELFRDWRVRQEGN